MSSAIRGCSKILVSKPAGEAISFQLQQQQQQRRRRDDTKQEKGDSYFLIFFYRKRLQHILLQKRGLTYIFFYGKRRFNKK